jgi:hypothetical protein
MLTGSVSRTPRHGCCRVLVIDNDSDHAASQLVNEPLAEPQVEITAQIGGTSGAEEIRTVESAQLGRKQEAVARNENKTRNNDTDDEDSDKEDKERKEEQEEDELISPDETKEELNNWLNTTPNASFLAHPRLQITLQTPECSYKELSQLACRYRITTPRKPLLRVANHPSWIWQWR